MTRRLFLSAAAAALAAPAATTRSKMGVCTTSYLTVWRPKDTLEFFDHCEALGAGGIQAALTSFEPAYLKTLREKAQQRGMYLESMAPLPVNGDASKFEAAVKAAREVGALAIRSGCLSGRRYETFDDLASWKQFVANSEKSIALAVPIAEKYKMPMALENHKDWTLEEMVPLLKKYSSEYLGACLDVGNNISLLDDPMAVITGLAPYALATHIKDMAVDEYRNGFLLSEMPLGAGMLDMKKVVAIITKARPKTRLTLEMITRNPLEVPCLGTKYWATFPDRQGRYLASTLTMVRERKVKDPLPRLDSLSAEARREFENENVKKCLAYSREQLETAS
jgi:sugar phosphate isomerase/epimerase